MTATATVGLPRALLTEITERHIARGRPCVGDACALVLAVRDAFFRMHGMTPLSVTANSHDVEVVVASGIPTVRYHHDAGEFVRRFDAGQRVAPRYVYLWRPGREYMEAPAA